MKLRLNFKLAAIVTLAISVTTAASYMTPRQNPTEASRSLVQSGELSRQALIGNQLRELLEPVGIEVGPDFRIPEEPTAKQLTIHWETASADKTAASTEQAAGRFAVTNFRVSSGRLPRRRSVELAESEVFVAAVDGAGRLVWWDVMTDPRLLRAEAVADSGEVSGRVLYRPNIDFLISYPDSAAIKELRLYHPQWTGERFRLTPLAVMAVQ